MPEEIFFNAFTRVTSHNVALREMQVANPREIYPIGDAGRTKPDIDVTVRNIEDADFIRDIFNSPMTGYFQKQERFYYRNCNIANDLNWPDVFYRGRLPNSLLRVRINTFEPLKIDVQCSANYRRESRSRLSRIPSIDETVNNLLLAAAIWRGFLPMHAAAIEVGPSSRRRCILFMGLPNTGKTQTSVSACKLMSGEYLAEDICFARAENGAVYGGPYTLDETKIQNYAELKAKKFIGAPLGAIVLLQRTTEVEKIKYSAAGSTEMCDLIADMNRYEFNWEHDLVVRHVLIGAASQGMTATSISQRYEEGIQQLNEKVCGFILSGKDPSRWGPLLVTGLRKAGIA